MRRSARVSAAVTAVAIAAAAGAAAAQPSPGAPVTINSCGPILRNQNQAQAPSLTDLLAAKSAGIRIEFVNDSTKTADLVNFAVDSNGERFIIRDVGTFSPNVSIAHTYRNGAGQAFVLPAFIAPNITCSVASVKFSDGTSWPPSGAPSPATAPSGSPGRVALSAHPARLDIAGIGDAELFLISSSEGLTAFRESDTCTGIASIFVAATGRSSATYSVKPLATGSCRVTVTDEAGNALTVPITVRP